MMKTFRKVFALLVAMVMAVSLSVPVFAATTENVVEAASEEPDPETVDELYDEIARYEADNGISTASADYTIIDKVGVTSNSSVSFTFDSLANCYGTVSLVMYCKYSNGSTGTVKVTCAYYTYNSVKVDGTSRLIDSGLYIPIGTYNFKISGIDSKMTYVIRLYSHVD